MLPGHAAAGGRASTGATRGAGQQAVARARRRQEGEGARDDDARGVLQGRSRALELAHDWPDAHHLRLLSTLHEAARRSAREGDRVESALVWKLERHGQGARHRTGLARRGDRQGARDRGAGVSRRPGGQSGSELSREAGRQDVQGLAEGHRLRRAQRRVPASEHHDVQADGRRRRRLRARVLLGRRRVHRVEGISTAQERRAEIPVRDDEGAAGARGKQQAVGRPDRHGQ